MGWEGSSCFVVLIDLQSIMTGAYGAYERMFKIQESTLLYGYLPVIALHFNLFVVEAY
jgi:hypothetical protein